MARSPAASSASSRLSWLGSTSPTRRSPLPNRWNILTLIYQKQPETIG
ncbi:unnamed protein product [Gulo gulo]|uniref:Uncharacterized protein n=1 Tax=Gulo gulo TaxID=48420 RepID=A0A9X9Q794_GULGU|nr:unnamed protein product [Gulo gulo]